MIGLAVVTVGCYRPAGEMFARPGTTIVWPDAPQPARIRLIGTITDSGDLNAERSAREGFAATLRGPRPPVQFKRPHAMAHGGGGRVAVADSGGAAVHILDLTHREHVMSVGASDQRLATPVGVTWVDDELLVSDAERGEIVVFDVAGRLLRRFGSDDVVRPVGLVYLPVTSHVIVVDAGAHRLCVFDREGVLIKTLGERGTDPGQFNFPTHIAFDGADRLAIADTGNFRVQLLDLNGDCQSVIGKKGNGAGDLALPKGVAFDSAGHLYVVDAQFENFQVFDAEGRLLLAVGEEGQRPGSFSLPAGMAIDSRDRIWVADSANARIQIFQYLANPQVPRAPSEAGS